MTLMYWMVGPIALALLVYLFIALLKPEKFFGPAAAQIAIKQLGTNGGRATRMRPVCCA